MSPTRDARIVAAFLALALAVGGAGLAFPLLEMMLELTAIGLAAYLIVSRRSWRFNKLTRAALVLLALILLLPLVQLLPLPPAVWHGLPGREGPAGIDALLGWDTWRPWTLDVEATLRSFLRVLPAAAAFLACLFLPPPQRARLLLIVVGFALGGALLGVLQLVTGGRLTPYPSGHLGYPVGLFVNRNHNAAFMLASMPLLGALAASAITHGKRPTPVIIGAVSLLLILIVVVLGTTSRMAFALLPIAVAACLFILFRRNAPFRMVLPSLGVVVAILLYLFASGGFSRTLARFSSLDDGRFGYWADVNWALDQYGLAGTGLGTFIPIFQSAETLDSITPAIVNHAHNDYLEVLLEGGLAGAFLLFAFGCFFAFVLYRLSQSRQSAERAANRTAAAASIVLLLLASIVDYPLRMPALSVTLAILCAVMLPAKADASKVAGRSLVPAHASPSARRWLWRAPFLVLLFILAILAVQAGMSARALAEGRLDAAKRFAPWSTRAHAELSTQALLAGRSGEAMAEAKAALLLSPISAPALRTAGLVSLSRGNPTAGARLMEAAVTLGWRDPLTQLWAVAAAEQSGEPQKALQRAEALFAQHMLVAPALAQLLAAPPGQGMPALLASRLSQNPAWRRDLFDAAASLPPNALARFEQLLSLLDRSTAPPTPQEVGPLLKALVERGEAAEAQRVWALLHRRALLTNGSLDEFDSGKRPLWPSSWMKSRRTGSAVAFEQVPGSVRNYALRIDGSQASTVLEQELMLPPGTYILFFSGRASGTAPVVLDWQIACASTGRKEVGSVAVRNGSRWSESTLLLTVPDQDCPIQKLALVRSRAMPNQRVWLDNIRLESAAR